MFSPYGLQDFTLGFGWLVFSGVLLTPRAQRGEVFGQTRAPKASFSIGSWYLCVHWVYPSLLEHEVTNHIVRDMVLLTEGIELVAQLDFGGVEGVAEQLGRFAFRGLDHHHALRR